MKNEHLLLEIERRIIIDPSVEYLHYLLDIFRCDKIYEALNLLKKDNISPKQLKEYIELFKEDYEYATKEIKKLEQIHNFYSEYYNRINYKKNENQMNNIILSQVLKSNMSAEEYAYKYGISLKKIKNAIEQSKNEQDILMILNNRNKDKFYLKFDKLMFNIQDNNFDIIDYLFETKMLFDDVIKISRKRIFSPNTAEAVKDKLEYFKTISEIKVEKEEAMCEKLVIDDVEITDEMKKEAFDFIKENELPNYVYETYLRRIIKRKVKTK